MTEPGERALLNATVASAARTCEARQDDMHMEEKVMDEDDALLAVDALHAGVRQLREAYALASLSRPAREREKPLMSPEILSGYVPVIRALRRLLLLCRRSRFGAHRRFRCAPSLIFCSQLVALQKRLDELRVIVDATWSTSYGRFADGGAVIDFMDHQAARALARWDAGDDMHEAQPLIEVDGVVAARSTLRVLSWDPDVHEFLRRIALDEHEKQITCDVERVLQLEPWPEVDALPLPKALSTPSDCLPV